MKSDANYTLYLVTDRDLMSTTTLEEAVEQAIIGGCTMIQLREKTTNSLKFYETALNIKRITDRYGVLLIINDRVDIALAVNAGGVHIGQNDLPASAARKIIGPDKILGVSASSLAEAVKAVEDGADYLGVGAMYPTGTKTDAAIVTMSELKKIRQLVCIPIVVIGGINKQTVANFNGIGIDGLAVVSAVIAQPDIASAAKELRGLFTDDTII